MYVRKLIFWVLLCTGFMASAQQQLLDPKETTQKYATLLYLINNYYVDSVDINKLVEDAIIGTLKDLDPHSAYISSEDVERANEPLVGSFQGIGISFQIYKDTILVIAPIPGGPSDKLGIMAGDKIITIDGEIAHGEDIDNQFVMDRLRGEKGTHVDVEIYRKAVGDELLDYTIERDDIPIFSLDAAFMADPNTAYVKINRFSQTTEEEFIESIEKLKTEGMENLILDLRGNSGGYLSAAIELADAFLDARKLIVYTEGLQSPRNDFYATDKGVFDEGKLIVLIDEGSASASEIVSGAVQDWDRGIVIGRRSFGKGLVQRPFNLPDGSQVRLTAAKYFTPSGRCIQKPYDDGAEEYYKDIANRYEHGELVNPDSIHFPDSLKYFTSRNRLVYGGGGIMPDIFMPFDSTRYNDLYAQLIRKGLMNQYVLDYLGNNRAVIMNEFATDDEFVNSFAVDQEMLKQLREKAEKEEVEVVQEEWEDAIILLKSQLKAMIGRNIWDLNTYFKIVMKQDETYLRALQLFDNQSAFAEMQIDY